MQLELQPHERDILRTILINWGLSFIGANQVVATDIVHYQNDRSALLKFLMGLWGLRCNSPTRVVRVKYKGGLRGRPEPVLGGPIYSENQLRRHLTVVGRLSAVGIDQILQAKELIGSQDRYALLDAVVNKLFRESSYGWMVCGPNDE